MIEAGRLRRAVHLDADRMSDGRWFVVGGSEPRVVDLEQVQACLCPDALNRHGIVCKHVLRVRLQLGDADVLRALRSIVPAPPEPRGRKHSTAGVTPGGFVG